MESQPSAGPPSTTGSPWQIQEDERPPAEGQQAPQGVVEPASGPPPPPRTHQAIVIDHAMEVAIAGILVVWIIAVVVVYLAVWQTAPADEKDGQFGPYGLGLLGSITWAIGVWPVVFALGTLRLYDSTRRVWPAWLYLSLVPAMLFGAGSTGALPLIWIVLLTPLAPVLLIRSQHHVSGRGTLTFKAILFPVAAVVSGFITSPLSLAPAGLANRLAALW